MMTEKNYEITEIRKAEERRAQWVMEDGNLAQWVKELRKKYIADGFLMPFYVYNNNYSIPEQRIREYGDFIQPCDMTGRVFYRYAPVSRIHQEAVWFWEYLISGQEAIFGKSVESLPDDLKIKGMPAEQVWKIITDYTYQKVLDREDGGGIMFSLDDLDIEDLAKIVSEEGVCEEENGYMEPFKMAGEPRWITLFHRYDGPGYANTAIEVRPAWFHLANYAFFNTPITRLPVFLYVFKKGKMNRTRFLDDGLSDDARAYIVKALIDMPGKLRKQFFTLTLERETEEMTWWLWHNVGHREYKRPLSYGDIAGIVGTSRSSIQTSVARFSRKLKVKLDGKLLGRLLRVSSNLGLGYNMTYNALVRQGLVLSREGGIDSFDELDKLV